LWRKLLEAGKEAGLVPAGLGARDTLRLEAKMCLYGNDMDETTTLVEAGLGWIVSLEAAKGDFVGRRVLEAQKKEGAPRKLVGFVELPEVGKKVKAHERFGTVESVKAVSDLFSPVGGEVVEVNSALVAKPEAVNADPYGAGWMIRLKLDPGGPSDLMDAGQYTDFVAKEAK